MKLMRRFHWIATMLAAAILALASQGALAHGGQHHELPAATPQAAAQGAGESAAAVAAVQAAPAVPASWSQSCPDGSGGDCCCKHQPAGTGVAKVAVVNSNGWARPASSPSTQPARAPLEILPRQSFVSPALPRAPPSFS